ncbi:hypothetical protein ACFX13_027816 [Malus domestica]
MAFPAMQLQLSYTKTVIVIIGFYPIQIIKAISILLFPHAINVQALNPLTNGAKKPCPQHRRGRVSELRLQPHHIHDGTISLIRYLEGWLYFWRKIIRRMALYR